MESTLERPALPLMRFPSRGSDEDENITMVIESHEKVLLEQNDDSDKNLVSTTAPVLVQQRRQLAASSIYSTESSPMEDDLQDVVLDPAHDLIQLDGVEETCSSQELDLTDLEDPAALAPHHSNTATDLSPDDLAVDASLTPLEQLDRYIQSDLVLHRLFVIREMRHAMDTASSFEEAVQCIAPKLEQLANDVEPFIREAFAVELPNISQYFIQADNTNAWNTLRLTVMRIAAVMLLDEAEGVKNAAHEALVSMAKSLPQEHLELHICALIKQLASNESYDICLTASLELLRDVAEVLGADLCVRYGTPLVRDLHQHCHFILRRSCVECIASMSQVLTPELLDLELIHFFARLAEDEVWGIRRAVAQTLPSLAMKVTSTSHQQILLPISLKLLHDPSRWVTASMYESVGGFIASFAPGTVPCALLDAYIALVTPTRSAHLQLPMQQQQQQQQTSMRDPERPRLCAFYLPGVVQAMGGASGWHHLKSVFELLSHDPDASVRRPIAFSLHVLAQLLGPRLAHEDLSPVFERMCRDVAQVRAGPIEHWAAFVQCLESESRDAYLPLMHEVLKESGLQWRLRQCLALQLKELCPLYKPGLVSQFVLPLAMVLVNDSVAAVRFAVREAFGAIYAILKDFCDASLKEDFIERLIALSSADPYPCRLSFLHLFGSLIGTFSAEELLDLFGDILPRLAQDKVTNVRIALSRLFAEKVLPVPRFAEDARIQMIHCQLLKDQDRDVVSYLVAELPPRPRKAKEQPLSATVSINISSPDRFAYRDDEEDVDRTPTARSPCRVTVSPPLSTPPVLSLSPHRFASPALLDWTEEAVEPLPLTTFAAALTLTTTRLERVEERLVIQETLVKQDSLKQDTLVKQNSLEKQDSDDSLTDEQQQQLEASSSVPTLNVFDTKDE